MGNPGTDEVNGHLFCFVFWRKKGHAARKKNKNKKRGLSKKGVSSKTGFHQVSSIANVYVYIASPCSQRARRKEERFCCNLLPSCHMGGCLSAYIACLF